MANNQAFLVCYSGTDRYGNNHTPYKAIAHTADEAIAVINTWRTYGKPDSQDANPSFRITVNPYTEKKIREYFAKGKNVTWEGYELDYLSVRTTGCGCWDIIIRPALADTLEEHERIYNEQREAAKAERMRQAEVAKQRRLAELNEQKRGWYHVELEIKLYVFRNKGNDYIPVCNYSCTLIADSGMDAYNKTFEYLKEHPDELQTKGMSNRGDIAVFQSACAPTSRGYEFTFLGVKTDEGYSVEKWEEWHKNGEI